MSEVYNSIEFLKSKIQGWTKEQANSFHSTAEKAYPEKMDYIWAETNNDATEGFVHYGPKFAAYYNAQGEETLLSSEFLPEVFEMDWNANKALYQESIKDGSNFRMVNPVGFKVGGVSGQYQSMTIDETPYIYYRLQHPDTDLGTPYLLSRTVSHSFGPRYFIDNCTPVLRALKKLVDDGIISGYPSIKAPWLCVNTGGAYWRHFHYYHMSAKGLYAKLVGELQKYMQQVEKNGSTIDYDGLETYGKEQWAQALNI